MNTFGLRRSGCIAEVSPQSQMGPVETASRASPIIQCLAAEVERRRCTEMTSETSSMVLVMLHLHKKEGRPGAIGTSSPCAGDAIGCWPRKRAGGPNNDTKGQQQLADPMVLADGYLLHSPLLVRRRHIGGVAVHDVGAGRDHRHGPCGHSARPSDQASRRI